ncbi:MAG: DUF6290 family protein [Methanomassiliicoccaceae archaeon]|jgi:predicted DNA-binding protein|nr:DUF6290 family protein [Methanomassiliicoccaceae archaeon]
MAAVPFGFSEEQLQVMFRYAEVKNMSLSDVVSEMIETIEDRTDLWLCDEALDEFKRSGESSRPIKELWKELGI